LTKATWIQLAIGAAVALGLVGAAVWRGESARPATSREPASKSDPGVPAANDAASAADPAPSLLVPRAPPVPTPAPQDEASLMAQLRRLADEDPARAIELAREGNKRFPGSPDASERTSILIHALAREGFATEARRTAEDMVNHFPDSRWVQEIEQFTGAHRHRNVRLNADGGIEFY